ncbi:MAG: hypothetical protein IPJ56_17885 [Gemmatimonadetes bacterium]|nr:hypothetical protein [Gemmatimonadota bacterium]
MAPRALLRSLQRRLWRTGDRVPEGLAEAKAGSTPKPRRLGRGRVPIWGGAVVIKANTSLAGTRDHRRLGQLHPRRPRTRRPQDLTIVRAKLKAAGAIIVGSGSLCPDLANSDTNRSSSLPGRTGKHAYDVQFSQGARSGGVVTAVAANMAVLGNRTDTGNSITARRHQRARRECIPRAAWSALPALHRWTGSSTTPDPSRAPRPAPPSRSPSWPGEDSLNTWTLGAPLGHSARRPQGWPVPPGRRTQGSASACPPLSSPVRECRVPRHPGRSAGGAGGQAPNCRCPAPRRDPCALHAGGRCAARRWEPRSLWLTTSSATFAKGASRVSTYAYMQDGTDHFLASFGPDQYHSAAEATGIKPSGRRSSRRPSAAETTSATSAGALEQQSFDTDPDVEPPSTTRHDARCLTRRVPAETMDRLRLDV